MKFAYVEFRFIGGGKAWVKVSGDEGTDKIFKDQPRLKKNFGEDAFLAKGDDVDKLWQWSRDNAWKLPALKGQDKKVFAKRGRAKMFTFRMK